MKWLSFDEGDKKKSIFNINNQRWTIQYVNWNDIMLYDRTNTRTYATTNPLTHTVYVSNAISGDFLREVLLHEITHCILISYNMTNTIYTISKPEYRHYAEEWCCNLIAEHFDEVDSIINGLLYGG